MKKTNYKILGIFAAIFALVSVNVIGPMEAKASTELDFTVTNTNADKGNVTIIGNNSPEADDTYTFLGAGPETHTISGASFKIRFNITDADNIVGKFNNKYYTNTQTADLTSQAVNVGFESRYKSVTISNGTAYTDGTKCYYLVNGAKVWLTADGVPFITTTQYAKVDKSKIIKLNIETPVGGGVASYSLNGGAAATYSTPVELNGDVTTIAVSLSGGTLPFYIYGLSTETQTGSTLKLLGGQIVLYQNNLPVPCVSCVNGTATYALSNYNNLSIYMIPNAATGTTGTSSIVGQVSIDGINFVNITPNQLYQIANTARTLTVKFGTGTVTPTSTGADPKVQIYFKGLVGAGLSKDLKAITVPGGKVTMKASSIDQQFGHVDLSGNTSVTISSGSKVEITLTPNSGYTAQYKIGNGSFVTGNTISITPTSDQTITIQFASSAPAKTTTNKDKVPKTGIFHNYVLIFGILAFVVAICVAGVIIYFKKNDKDKEKTR